MWVLDIPYRTKMVVGKILFVFLKLFQCSLHLFEQKYSKSSNIVKNNKKNNVISLKASVIDYHKILQKILLIYSHGAQETFRLIIILINV